MAVHFSEDGLKFLRGLARHNDREWFGARKTVYETQLKAPLLALIAEINEALLDFAPEHVRPPQKAMMRIYRDIRFSANKAPYKTQIAAWWSRDGIDKTSGAGFYTSVGPAGVTVAAGVYAPDKVQLLAIRRHLTVHHAEFLKLVESKKMRSTFPEFEGQSMTRPPKGFAEMALPPEAMKLVMCRQWGVSTTLPVETALGPGLLKEIVSRFRLAAPMIALLNEPLQTRAKKPLF